MISEIYAAVEELNDEMYVGLDWYVPFSMESFGYANTYIKFMGEVVWQSQDDPRDFDEDRNEYEPLKPFLIKEARKMFADLALKISKI